MEIQWKFNNYNGMVMVMIVIMKISNYKENIVDISIDIIYGSLWINGNQSWLMVVTVVAPSC